VRAVAPRVVVIGGMARVYHCTQDATKDLDLFWDVDSQAARNVIESAVARARKDDVNVSSQVIGNWTLRDAIDDPNYWASWDPQDHSALDTAMVELLPIIEASRTYRAIRRNAILGDFCGILLWFASLDDVRP